MDASPRDVQRILGPRPKTQAISEYPCFSPAPKDLPPELLLEIAQNIDDTEDLQRLRLVSRAFSNAATTALQDRFTNIYILPLQSSMARFTRLTKNPLIGPKIRHVNVMYGPPVAASDVPRACLDLALPYGMQLQSVKDIISEYNERYTDSRPADDDSMSKTVVSSGDFERVLGEGLHRLSELRCVFMCREALNSFGDTSSLLNLPKFLQLGVSGKSGGDKFGAIQHLTVAHYVKNEILRHLYLSSLSRVSPIEVLGALSQWPVASGERGRTLCLAVQGLSSLDEPTLATRLSQKPRLLNDSMANLTSIDLVIASPRPPQHLAARLDSSGEEHHDLGQGPRWSTLIQAAVNLKLLRLNDISEWSAGFDNLLQLIFETATWPMLTEIYIERDYNIGLLPAAPRLFKHSLGWYLFLQRDLDRFLLRHKNTPENLALRNIIGVDECVPPPQIGMQWPQPGFPSDPKPSFSLFERSLKLWRRELKKLKWADVNVLVEFSHEEESGVESWIEDSEAQALASATGATCDVEIVVVEEDSLGSMEDSSWATFNWSDWLLDREDEAAKICIKAA
jgi:hypothetical protein